MNTQTTTQQDRLAFLRQLAPLNPVERVKALRAVMARDEQTRPAAAPDVSLADFAKRAWHVVEPATPYVHGWHLDAIAEHLEAVTRGEIRNLLINMPPRHMKSLAVSVFWPVWVWTFAPSKRWLFASYALTLSVRDSLKCRRLIESPWFQSNYGHVFRLTSDQNAKMRFENDRTGYRIATSVGGAATGEGGDFVVVDDPHNVEQAESDVQRESALTWWDQTMSTRLNDQKTGGRVIVMQRLHQSDLAGHVLEKGTYEHLCLPAEYEPMKFVPGHGFTNERHTTQIGWTDPRTEPGQLLWEDRFGRAELDAMKIDLGSYGGAGQLQQRPTPAEGGTFKREWWKFWRELPADATDWTQSWDCAFKDLQSSDFVVGQLWCRSGGRFFLVDQVRARMDFPTTIQAVKAFSAKHPKARAKLVEDKANGSAVIAALRHEVPGLIAVEPDGGKESRAAGVSPMVEAGNVYLPDPQHADAPWVNDFIEEAAAFPKGSHDDQVDAMTQALNRLYRRPLAVLPKGMTRPSQWLVR